MHFCCRIRLVLRGDTMIPRFFMVTCCCYEVLWWCGAPEEAWLGKLRSLRCVFGILVHVATPQQSARFILILTNKPLVPIVRWPPECVRLFTNKWLVPVVRWPLECLHRLSVLFSQSGQVVNSSIDGCIQMKSYLSGESFLPKRSAYHAHASGVACVAMLTVSARGLNGVFARTLESDAMYVVALRSCFVSCGGVTGAGR